jgi:hypothetical protein
MQTITYAHDRTHFQGTRRIVSLLDVKVWCNCKVYFHNSSFEVNSVVFHFDDFNYERRITTIFFFNNCNSAGFFHSAVSTHLNHRKIFLFATRYGVGSLNINCKPHWLAICYLFWIFFFLDRQFRS